MLHPTLLRHDQQGDLMTRFFRELTDLIGAWMPEPQNGWHVRRP